MAYENDTKLEEWFTSIGAPKFQAINELIDSTVEQVQAIIPKDEFLATLESRLLEVAAHIINTKEFKEGISDEYMYCEIDKTLSEKVDSILESFISNSLLKESTPVVNGKVSIENTTPQTKPVAPLAGLQSRLTQSNMIMPVKRDLSPDATPATAPSVPTKPAIDPYRELPEK